MAWPTASAVSDACASLPGRNILDVTPDNIGYYACGVWSLVERDILTVLPASCADEVLSLLTSDLQLPVAFGLRNELCNLKKCTFFVLQQSHDIERMLAQLATFFHGEHVSTVQGTSGFWQHSARLDALSDARSQAKGAVAGVADSRSAGKHCCNVPRHPSKAPPDFLTRLPQSLQAFKIATAAAAAATAVDGKEPACDVSNPDSISTSIATTATTVATWHDRAASLLDSQPHWPPHVRRFVQAVLISRGADKALCVNRI